MKIETQKKKKAEKYNMKIDRKIQHRLYKAQCFL